MLKLALPLLILSLVLCTSGLPIADENDEDFNWDTDSDSDLTVPEATETSDKPPASVTPDTHIQKIPRRSKNKLTTKSNNSEQTQVTHESHVPSSTSPAVAKEQEIVSSTTKSDTSEIESPSPPENKSIEFDQEEDDKFNEPFSTESYEAEGTESTTLVDEITTLIATQL